MTTAFNSAALALASAALYILYALFIGRSKRPDLPPGPPHIPILGNAHQLPQLDQHKTFMEWAVRYGNIVYAEFFTQPAIIISSTKVAYDLMEKRGARYSNRPRFVRINEMIGWTGNMGFRQYGDEWKRHRKWYQRGIIARSAVNSYQPIALRQVRHLLHDLLRTPNDFKSHLKRFSASLIFEMGYGHTIQSLDGDEFMKSVQGGIREALSGSGSGSAMVDVFPILKFVPAWMPGAGLKRATLTARDAITAMEDIPHNAVKADMAAGVAKPSLTTFMIQDCMNRGPLTKEDESDIKGVSGTFGNFVRSGNRHGDNHHFQSLTSMIVFVLVMTQYPEIFEKAQQELISVVGENRLPDLGDRASLPYLECVIREVYRWCPALPTALPHQSADDDIYNGYYIPKGAMIVPNIWAMFRDPEVYPEPDIFRPERFLGLRLDGESDLRDPKKVVFGFGRRICPGRYFADNNVWLAAANITATMNICKALNSRGEEITPTPEFLSGIVIHPEPFVCNIHPRSEEIRQLIIDSLNDTGC